MSSLALSVVDDVSVWVIRLGSCPVGDPRGTPAIWEGRGTSTRAHVDRGSAVAAAGIHIYYLLSASVVLFAAGCQVGLVQGGFSPPAV